MLDLIGPLLLLGSLALFAYAGYARPARLGQQATTGDDGLEYLLLIALCLLMVGGALVLRLLLSLA